MKFNRLKTLQYSLAILYGACAVAITMMACGIMTVAGSMLAPLLMTIISIIVIFFSVWLAIEKARKHAIGLDMRFGRSADATD
jgi:branched-subunit amino acid permease